MEKHPTNVDLNYLHLGIDDFTVRERGMGRGV
jgi:hypothetical protein